MVKNDFYANLTTDGLNWSKMAENFQNFGFEVFFFSKSVQNKLKSSEKSFSVNFGSERLKIGSKTTSFKKQTLAQLQSFLAEI